MGTEPQGCLAFLLSFLGIKLGDGARSSGEELPYRRRDDFLSPAELSFYRVLAQVVSDRGVICPKVNLADIFFVVNPNEHRGARSKISQKHVDFLVCDPATMKPLFGVELDDSSHARADRQQRDALVNAVFEAAALPLVRVPARASYNLRELSQQLEAHWAHVVPTTPPPPPVSLNPRTSTPTCPKCGVPMLQRIAKRGTEAGQMFYGCPNYPKCRETIGLD